MRYTYRFIMAIAILFSALVNTAAQTPPPPSREALDGLSAAERYETWTKDLPRAVVEVKEDQLAFEGKSVEEGADLFGMIDPAENIIMGFSAFIDENWEIVLAPNKSVAYYNGKWIRLTSNSASDIQPSMLPGTTQIVFASNRSGNYDIYWMDYATNTTRALTDAPGYDAQPCWSPDGKKILFVSDRTGDEEIFVMNANGSGVTQLTGMAGDDFNPSWSRDGSKIVWVHAIDQENGQIYQMKPDGSEIEPFYQVLKYPGHPVYSNNYETVDRIFFEHDRNEDYWFDISGVVVGQANPNINTIKFGTYLVDYINSSRFSTSSLVNTDSLTYSVMKYVVEDHHLYLGSTHTCVKMDTYEQCWGGDFDSSYPTLYSTGSMIDINKAYQPDCQHYPEICQTGGNGHCKSIREQYWTL